MYIPDQERQPSKVCLVEWQSEGGKGGRIVDLDSEYNLKPVVPVGAKRNTQNFLDIPGSLMLLPQIGVTWSRDKRKGPLAVKNSVPEHWRRLLDMWQVFLAAEPENCQLCHDDPDNAVILPGAEDLHSDPVSSTSCATKCPVCCLALHHECANKVSQVVFDRSLDGPSSLSSTSPLTSCRIPERPFTGKVFPDEFFEKRTLTSTAAMFEYF